MVVLFSFVIQDCEPVAKWNTVNENVASRAATGGVLQQGLCPWWVQHSMYATVWALIKRGMAQVQAYAIPRKAPASSYARLSSAKVIVTALVFWSGLSGPGINAVNAQPSPVELIASKCPVMQDFLDDLLKDYDDLVRIRKRDENVSRMLLNRLSLSKIETVERLFKCFDFDEETVAGRKRIITKIPVAKLNIPTTPEK
jgi:hypothetical protein